MQEVTVRGGNEVGTSASPSTTTTGAVSGGKNGAVFLRQWAASHACNGLPVRWSGMLLAAVAFVAPARAHGYDAEVRADTHAQAYQVRGPLGSPVISSRRVTQSLSLAVVDRWGGSRGVTVSFRLRLRFDADFGEACDPATDRCLDETNTNRSGEFVPLFARRTMDVPFAYVDVTGLGRGRLDLRAGRIFHVDPLGFFLFDGVRARVHLGGFAVAEALAGFETRAGFPLSNGRFEREGLIRADRGSWDPSLAPYVLHRDLAPVVGAAIESAAIEPVFARMSYRRVWTNNGIAEEKVGGAIDARATPRVRFHGDVVFSIPQQLIASMNLSGEWFDGQGNRVGMELSRYRPTFDLNSIWSAFWIDATDDARVYCSIAVSPRVTLTGSWLLRRYALGETASRTLRTEPEETGDAWNTGGHGAVVVRTPAWQGTVRAQVEGGAIGARAGIDTDAAWWLLPERIRIEGRLSLWHAMDERRPQRSGLSLGGVIGATVRLGSLADLHIDLEDDVNRIVGHRFRLAAILALRGPF